VKLKYIIDKFLYCLGLSARKKTFRTEKPLSRWLKAWEREKSFSNSLSKWKAEFSVRKVYFPYGKWVRSICSKEAI